MRDDYAEKRGEKRARNSNVKHIQKYENSGENFRFMTFIEWQKFLGVIDDFKHKLMMRLLYELSCRVGELVRIQLKHPYFNNSSIFFPAENTKTKQAGPVISPSN